MTNNGFLRCQADHCCYIKRFDCSYIISPLYVNDMLIAGTRLHGFFFAAETSINEIDKLKKKLSKEFTMKDLGVAKQILEMRITRDREVLKLSHEEYVKKMLSRFKMVGAKPVSTPLANHFCLSKDQSLSTEHKRVYKAKMSYTSAISSLIYGMVCTRLDIAPAMGIVSKSIHEVLTWFGQPCLRPQMRENDSTIQ